MGEIKMSNLPGKGRRSEPKKNTVIRMGEVPDRGTEKIRENMKKFNRTVSEVLKQGEWEGQRCFIIGGGASVKDFDLSKLKGEKVIGVNMAFRLLDPDIIYAMDARLWGWIEEDEVGPNDNINFLKSDAIKVWSDITASPLPEEIVIAPSVARPGMSTSLKEGVACGTNSGFGALNLALLLGASEIYLVGYDFYGDRWHEGYPQGGDVGHDYHVQCYENAAEQIKEAFPNQKIINLNPESALKCFEFGTIPDDLGEKNGEEPVKREQGEDEPVFVSFYTKGSGYDKFAKDLIKSLEKLNLEHDVQAIKSKGNWDKNTKFKATFLKKMQERHPGRTLVWIDADAIVNDVPTLLLETDKDIAVHYRGDEGVLSGCVLIRPTEETAKVLNSWEKACKDPKNEKVWDQKLLDEVLKDFEVPNIERLPAEYCYIIGLPNEDIENPIIEQRQASRKLKK